MAVIVNGNTISLTGVIGYGLFGDDCFTHGDVLVALATIPDNEDIVVKLNSPGGFADEGSGIRNALRSRAGSCTIVVEGIAASAASLVACAGDEVVMSPGSLYMLHEPMTTLLSANSVDLALAVERQKAYTNSYARVYSERSGKSEDEIRSLLLKETWYTPEEAVEEGFADRVGEDRAKKPPAFAYQEYAHAPDRLVAMSRARNWTLKASAHPPRPTASTTPPNGEATMPTDAERADALAAELETLKATMAKQTTQADADELATLRAEKADRERRDAIMALPEAEGRTEQAEALVKAGVTADAAKAVLAAAPKPVEPKRVDEPQTYERTRMAAGAGLSGGQQNGGQPSKSAAIMSNYRLLTGPAPKH